MKPYKRGFKLDDGRRIYFDYGTFDSWCVYVEEDDKRISPKDTMYFNELYGLGEKYGFSEVYDSFCMVFDAVKRCGWNLINKTNCLNVCQDVASLYDEDTLSLWVTLYMTMLAEEMKKNTKLGKRIKKLAVYYILMEQRPIEETTKAMVGKRWWELDREMQEVGI